jgi:hypothetical protein
VGDIALKGKGNIAVVWTKMSRLCEASAERGRDDLDLT